jgi:predicted Zn-dependent protease
MVNRDAETETLLRNCANPLFRAAGLAAKLVRSILRHAAINSFMSTGNRMFINRADGLPRRARKRETERDCEW